MLVARSAAFVQLVKSQNTTQQAACQTTTQTDKIVPGKPHDHAAIIDRAGCCSRSTLQRIKPRLAS
jgi:hypothetical protein